MSAEMKREDITQSLMTRKKKKKKKKSKKKAILQEISSMKVDFFRYLVLAGEFQAAGLDGIPPEAIKADLETSAEMLYNLFGKVCHNEISDDWKEGYLIKFPKKVDLKECKNWRGINCRKSVEQNNPGETESRGG